MQIFKENGKAFCQFGDQYPEQYIQNYRARINSVWNETQMTMIVETFVSFIDGYTEAFMKADFPGDPIWVFTQLSAINDHVKAHGYRFAQEDLELEKLEKPLFKFLHAAEEGHALPDGLVFPYSVNISISKPHQFILRRYYRLGLPKLSKHCFTAEHYQEAYDIVNHLLSEAIQSIQKAAGEKLSYSSLVTNLKCFKAREEKSIDKLQPSTSGDSNLSNFFEGEKNLTASSLSSLEAGSGKRERKAQEETEAPEHRASKKSKLAPGSAEIIAKRSPIFSSSASSSSSNDRLPVFDSKGHEADAALAARMAAPADERDTKKISVPSKSTFGNLSSNVSSVSSAALSAPAFFPPPRLKSSDIKSRILLRFLQDDCNTLRQELRNYRLNSADITQFFLKEGEHILDFALISAISDQPLKFLQEVVPHSLLQMTLAKNKFSVLKNFLLGECGLEEVGLYNSEYESVQIQKFEILLQINKLAVEKFMQENAADSEMISSTVQKNFQKALERYASKNAAFGKLGLS